MLDQVPEGVVWAVFLLPLGSFAAISAAALLGLTRDPSTGSGRAVWEARLSGYLTIAAIAGSLLLSLWVPMRAPSSWRTLSSTQSERRNEPAMAAIVR